MIALRAARSALAALALLLGASTARAQWHPPQAPQAPQSPAPAAPPSMFGGMMGGLQIPPPTPPSPESIRVGEALDAAKREDSGRGLEWVWADVGTGFEQLGLQALTPGSAGFLSGLAPASASGGVVSAGVGARRLYFTLLVRGRIGFFDNGQLYRVGVEGGFHVPFGRVEPRVTLGVGYAEMADLHGAADVPGAPSLTLRGLDARAGAGIDYYVTPVFSIGADVSAELLGLTRAALSTAQVSVLQKGDPGAMLTDTLLQSITGWGGTLSLTAVAGLHF